MYHIFSLLIFLSLLSSTFAQFQFFEQMFSGNAHHHRQHQQQQPQNVASDSAWYRQTYDGAYCTNYLCPSTLACVQFPHHCPCAFPNNEDKIEFGEGSALCVSKGGWKPGEAAKKVELARKGLI